MAARWRVAEMVRVAVGFEGRDARFVACRRGAGIRMQDDDDLDVFGRLEDWGWRKPSPLSDAEFGRLSDTCLLFLSDAPPEITAQIPATLQTSAVLEELAERSRQRLSRFMPDFRTRFEQADAVRQRDVLDEALAWSTSRFERMIIQNCVRGWQLSRDAGLVDDMLSVDELILRAAHNRWQKVAMIVGKIMMARRGLVDMAIAERVKILVQRGMLQAQGDLAELRHSEVRLPTDNACSLQDDQV